MQKIVFVCSGNTCRSPMAKAILAGILADYIDKLEPFEVLSAGLRTVDGLPASPNAIETMAVEGIDISNHRTRQLQSELILSSDYILTMTRVQRNHLKDKYPEKAPNIYTVSEFAGRIDHDIIDPYGQGLAAYQECSRQLKELLPGVVFKLQKQDNSNKQTKIKVAIGSDHAGFHLKNEIIRYLEAANYEVLDCGTFSEESVDYPDIAEKVAQAVLTQKIIGIIICGTGIGISIAANKIPGIRAALCYNAESARLARQHNDSNIVAIGARLLEQELALEIVKSFLAAGFEAGRHQQRIDKIAQLEKKWLERSH